MANNKYITVDQLNSVITKIDKNFSKKKNSLTKVELKELKVADFSNGEITKDGLYLVETYVDHGVLEADGVTKRVHVDYIEVNVELGTSIEDWTSGKDYKVNDLVIKDKKLYRCKTAPQVDNTVFDITEWDKIGSGEFYTETIDQTSFALNTTSNLYEYEFNNPFKTKNVICSLQRVSDDSLMLDTIKVTDTKIKVLLNTPESVIINIMCGNGVDETTILKDALTTEQLRLLGIVQAQEGEITSLELVEHKDDVSDPDLVTSKELQFDGKRLLTTDDIKKSIEDWVSGTDYTVGTLVIYNDKLYQCKIVPVDNTIFDKTEWQLVGTSGTIYTKTIDSTAFTLIDGVYEYEFTNPYNNKNIIASLQKEDGTLLLDTLIISDNTIKVKLNIAETVIVNIAGYELNEALIEKDALTDEQKRLLKIVSDYEKEITNLKVVETLDTDGITVLSKELQFNGEKVLTESVDTITKDETKVITSGGVYNGLYVEKTQTVIDTPAYYSVCQSTDSGALNVVTVVTDGATQILLNDINTQTTPEDLSTLTGDGTEYVKHIAEVNHEETYDEEKYALKDNTYTKTEVNNKITEALSGGIQVMEETEWDTYFNALTITAKDGGN